jgi:Ser/Thr protein kinase RdoA (MazF antagonist)
MSIQETQQERLKGIADAFCARQVRQLQILPLGAGNINDTYLVSSPDMPSAFVLQKINRQVFKSPWDVIENSGKLYRHLFHKGFALTLPEPLSTQEGRLYYIDEQEDYWRAFTYISPSHTVEYATTPDMAFRAGEAMALFLSGLSDLDPGEIVSVIPHFHHSSLRLVHFKEVLAADLAGRVSICGEAIDFLLKECDVFRQVDESGFPQRVVHNDAKIGNMLFHPETGQAVAVIDWDTAMPGAIPSDFGDMVRTMATTLGENDPRYDEVHLRRDWFEALARGFILPLRQVASPVELEGLVLGAKWIILEQMMRFLGDYLQGDTYYKTAYPDHNLVRARNQMALYRSLLLQEDDLQRIVVRKTW